MLPERRRHGSAKSDEGNLKDPGCRMGEGRNRVYSHTLQFVSAVGVLTRLENVFCGAEGMAGTATRSHQLEGSDDCGGNIRQELKGSAVGKGAQIAGMPQRIRGLAGDITNFCSDMGGVTGDLAASF